MLKYFKNLPYDNVLLMLFLLVIVLYFILTLDEKSKKKIYFEKFQENVNPDQLTEEEIIEKFNNFIIKIKETVQNIKDNKNQLSNLESELQDLSSDEVDERQRIISKKFQLINDLENLKTNLQYLDNKFQQLKTKYPQIYESNFVNNSSSSSSKKSNNQNSDENSEENSEENSDEKPDETKEVKLNKSTTVVHNHYYGGNKELTKFLKQLIQNNKKNPDMTLNTDYSKMDTNNSIDSDLCNQFYKETENMTLDDIKKNRLLTDLKIKCTGINSKKDTCKVQPITVYTSLLGTTLNDASDTKYGSIIQE